MSTALLISSVAMVTACNNETVEIKDDKKATYNKELKDFVYPSTVTSTTYSGVLDYGHELHVVEKKEDEGNHIVYTNILLDDMSGLQDKADLTYLITQTIKKDQIIERIEGKDPYFASIIPDKVILQAPLKEGAEWEQDVTLEDGKTIKAKTTIEKIVKNEHGKRIITTMTKFVDGIVLDYPKDAYFERATYEEGKGLIGFERPASSETPDYIFSYEYYKNAKIGE